MRYDQYVDWLDDFRAIKPHKVKHPNSFNNIIFSTELLLAELEMKTLTNDFLKCYMQHVKLTNTDGGGYAPKNSHDNLTAKMSGLYALESGMLMEMKLSTIRSGKHPRDWILYSFMLSSNPLYLLLLPLALLDVVRAIKSSGKVRPTYRERFWFRLKVKLGLIKPIQESGIMGGVEKIYEYEGKRERIIEVQNDGKILNLMRLNMLRDFWYLKPFVRYCKKLYLKKYGSDFQSQLFANYFEESDHPVRVAYRILDHNHKTIIDC